MFENMELTVLSRDRWRVLKFGSCGPKDLKKKKRLPYSSVQSLAGPNTEERRCLDGEYIISLTQPGEEVHS